MFGHDATRQQTPQHGFANSVATRDGLRRTGDKLPFRAAGLVSRRQLPGHTQLRFARCPAHHRRIDVPRRRHAVDASGLGLRTCQPGDVDHQRLRCRDPAWNGAELRDAIHRGHQRTEAWRTAHTDGDSRKPLRLVIAQRGRFKRDQDIDHSWRHFLYGRWGGFLVRDSQGQHGSALRRVC